MVKNISFMKEIIIILVFAFFSSCNSSKEVKEVKEDKLTTVEVLQKEESGGYSNIHFLILKDSLSIDDVKNIAESNCGKMCNQLYFWKDKKAYELLKFKRENYYSLNPKDKIQKEWVQKNWIFVCENLNYVYGQGEIEVFPYLDYKYKELGGKLKR
jgi:hypothetical protein